MLGGERPERSWAELAADLGGTEGALRVRAHRLRGRLREFLLAEARETLGDATEAEDELRRLLVALEA